MVAKETTVLNPKGYQIANLTKKKGLEIFKEFNTFRGDNPPDSFKEVSPIQVDHSVPGACGLIVETGEGAIVYTGDLRFHGPRREMTEKFVSKAKESEPSALVIEGTNLIDAKVSCEEEVESKISEVVSKENTTGLSMACFSINDIDRLNTFYRVAKETGRKLAISMKQAFLVHSLQNDPDISLFSLKDDQVLIFHRKKKTFYQWEQTLINTYGAIAAEDVEEMQKDLLLTATFYDMNELLTIKPVPGSTYIMSQSEPFNEEMEINFEKLCSWLEWFGIPHYHIHCSGHALPHQLKGAIKKIEPEKVFLVHTEKPELYKRFLGDLKNTKVITPQEGKKYDI